MVDSTTINEVSDVPNEAQEGPAPAEQPTGPQPSFEDYAARAYQTLLPRFRSEVEGLTGKQTKRVIVALMEYPLEKTEFKWNNSQEQRAFTTGAEIMDCRFVLMKALIELTVEQKKAILDEQKVMEETNGISV